MILRDFDAAFEQKQRKAPEKECREKINAASIGAKLCHQHICPGKRHRFANV